MPGISFEESLDQIGQLSEQADTARGAGEWQKAIDAFRELVDHPCAHHQVDDFEVLDDIHQILRSAGRYDEAIAAKREAIEAGYRSSPDPEADIAECLVEAGRRDEADALYAELRARDPDDVWLYNSAGYIYAGVDDREALRGCLDGIEVAIATGDPEQVVDQCTWRRSASRSSMPAKATTPAPVRRDPGSLPGWRRRAAPWRGRWAETNGAGAGRVASTSSAAGPMGAENSVVAGQGDIVRCR